MWDTVKEIVFVALSVSLCDKAVAIVGILIVVLLLLDGIEFFGIDAAWFRRILLLVLAGFAVCAPTLGRFIPPAVVIAIASELLLLRKPGEPASWYSWLFREGCFQRLSEELKAKLQGVGLAMILVGILVGLGIPAYVSVPSGLQVSLILAGVSVASQWGLGLLLVFSIGYYALAAGFLGSAIVIHALLLRGVLTSADPTVTRLSVMALLGLSAWYLGQGVFTPNPSLQIAASTPRQAAWPRYVLSALGVLLTVIEFFNIMYGLFNLGRGRIP